MSQWVSIIAGAALAGAIVATGGGAIVVAGFVLTGASLGAAVAIATLAIGALSMALAPKPAFSNLDSFSASFSGRTSQVKQPITARRAVVGETRASGPLAVAESSSWVNGENDYQHYVIVVATHEVAEIGTVYLGDEPIHAGMLNGSGHPTSGRYSEHAGDADLAVCRIKKHLGGDDQAADADLVAEVPDIDAAFRLRGCAYIYVRLRYRRKFYASGVPAMSADVRGKEFFDARTGTNLWSMNPAWAVRDYLTASRYGHEVPTARIDDTFFTAAANICDQVVDTLPVAQTVAVVRTADDALDLDGDLLLSQTGDRCQITTTGTVPTGLALATDYWIIAQQRGKTSTGGPDELVRVALASSYDNALAGTAIALSSVGTGTHTLTKDGEPRFTCSGVIDTDIDFGSMLRDLLGSMGGRHAVPGGVWRVWAAAWQSPTISFDEGDLSGDNALTVQTKHQGRDRFNGVKGLYVSPLHFGQPTDYPAVTSAEAVTEDNGEQIFTDLDLPFTSRAATAIRLAKIELQRHRRQATAQVRLNLTGLQSTVGDVIRLTNERWGYAEKTFEVVEWAFAFAGSAEVPIMVTNFGLRALDANAFNFDETTEEVVVNAASRTSLPSAFDTSPPTGLTLTSGNAELGVATDGTVLSRIRAAWTAPADVHVSDYELGWKPAAETKYTSLRLPIEATEHFIAPVQDGVVYDVRIRSFNIAGEGSDYAEKAHTVAGKSDLPSDVDEFTITRQADGTREYAWVHTSPAPDVRVGGGYKIKYKAGASLGDFDAATALHTGLLIASPFENNDLAAGEYTWGIKAVDSSGNESANAKTFTGTIGDPRLREVLLSRAEQVLGWPGTLVDFWKFNNRLRATASESIYDLPATIYELPSTIEGLVAKNSPCTYTTPTIDLGSDLTFTPIVSTDGSGTVTLTMQIGTAADGAPTGSFVALDQVAGYRYIKIKASVAGATPRLDSMMILLDGETKVDDFEDVNTASETASWFNSIATGHFEIGSTGDLASITQAAIRALQNVGPGWSWELISKAGTVNGEVAAEFKVYNASSTLANATVDVELKGPGKTT